MSAPSGEPDWGGPWTAGGECSAAVSFLCDSKKTNSMTQKWGSQSCMVWSLNKENWVAEKVGQVNLPLLLLYCRLFQTSALGRLAREFPGSQMTVKCHVIPGGALKRSLKRRWGPQLSLHRSLTLVTEKHLRRHRWEAQADFLCRVLKVKENEKGWCHENLKGHRADDQTGSSTKGRAQL